MSKLAIATMVLGDEAETIGGYSLPLMRDYARRCNADFLLLEASPLSQAFNAFYEKFQLGRLLDEYDRVLFLDADILVMPGSPDVFQQVPTDRLGAVSVESVFKHLDRSRRMTQQILGPIQWDQPYFNAGVILASRAQRALFDIEPIDRWHHGVQALAEGSFHDQDLFNYRVNALGIRLFDLGRAYNFTRAWDAFHHRFSQYFVHYAGLKGIRNMMMRHDAGVVANGTLWGLYTRHPWLVWLRDRVDRRKCDRRSARSTRGHSPRMT